MPERANVAFLASTDLVEVAVNMGSAQERFGTSLGSPVVIMRATR